ncbi:hypothetical protein [Candidatus Spongiihabitans sp.]|uniref:hypothetical protein n=1 Tax=Candidatus Spongiihabitans sp. TaxID=3101308 RepID=UPI003C79FE5C
MIEALVKTNNAIGRWFAARLEARIDRLWLGGVLGVSALVTALLDFRFVAIFLIGYFFIFALCARKQIQTVFPSKSNILYFNVGGTHETGKKIQNGVGIAFWIFAIVGYPLLFQGSVYLSAAGISALITNAVVIGTFAIYHRWLFSCYAGDCLVYRTVSNLTWNYKLHNWCAGFFKFIRPFGMVLLMVCLWCVALWLYFHGVNRIDQHYDFSAINILWMFAGPIGVGYILFLIFMTALLSMEE